MDWKWLKYWDRMCRIVGWIGRSSWLRQLLEEWDWILALFWVHNKATWAKCCTNKSFKRSGWKTWLSRNWWIALVSKSPTWWRTTHGSFLWLSSPQFIQWINPLQKSHVNHWGFANPLTFSVASSPVKITFRSSVIPWLENPPKIAPACWMKPEG